MEEEDEEIQEIQEEVIENIESEEQTESEVEETTEETSEEQVDETQEEETSEEVVPETIDQKVAQIFPERTFESDEEKQTALMQYVQTLEGYVEKGKQANAVLNARISEDPEFRAFLTDMMVDGLPFRLSIAKNFTQEELFPKEGEPDYDQLQEIRIEQKKRAKEQRELQMTLRNNSATSTSEISEFVKENNLNEESAAQFFASIDQVIADISQFKISKKTLEIFKKGLAFDAEVKNAAKVAEMKAMNQKIGKAIKGDVKTDGLPKVKPSADVVEKEMPKPTASKWVSAVRTHVNKTI